MQLSEFCKVSIRVKWIDDNGIVRSIEKRFKWLVITMKLVASSFDKPSVDTLDNEPPVELMLYLRVIQICIAEMPLLAISTGHKVRNCREVLAHIYLRQVSVMYKDGDWFNTPNLINRVLTKTDYFVTKLQYIDNAVFAFKLNKLAY